MLIRAGWENIFSSLNFLFALQALYGTLVCQVSQGGMCLGTVMSCALPSYKSNKPTRRLGHPAGMLQWTLGTLGDCVPLDSLMGNITFENKHLNTTLKIHGHYLLWSVFICSPRGHWISQKVDYIVIFLCRPEPCAVYTG